MSQAKSMRKGIQRLTSHTEFSVFLGLLLLCVAMSFASSYFLRASNLFNILNQISRYGIVSVGMALVIIAGGIDLSVGYSVGLTACLCAHFASAWNLPWYLILPLVLSIGAFIGLVNGLLVTRAKLVPFIVTMAMGKVLGGCTLLLTRGRPIKFQSELAAIGKNYIGPIPVAVIVMFLTIILGSIFAQRTLTGRNVYAVGNNERTAELSGINVKTVKTLTYVITGVLCALCGIIVAGNLSSADASLGVGYETDIIAAVVIGGVAMSGGEGTIWGSLIGAAIIGVLKNAFVLLGVSAYWQSIVIGVVIIIAVLIDKLRTSANR